MTDQTPDPWQIRLLTARLEDVIRDTFPENNGRTHFEECWRAHAPCVLRRALDVLNALAAERAQHQQEIVQRDETIRQLQDAFARCQEVQQATAETWRVEHDQMAEQIATLTQERDTLVTRLALQVGDASELAMLGNLIEQWTRADAVQHGERWDSRALKAKRANELIHRVNATLEAAEARCATLTAALEPFAAAWPSMRDAGATTALLRDYEAAHRALSGVPTP